ncbi:hypothetical protein DXV76_08455 [Rhodobacteraceae bacterium CCMM004]|nr:hypothetical protein DXV76_08455 [Rhodobacteraceae bacterium CCMM004]
MCWHVVTAVMALLPLLLLAAVWLGEPALAAAGTALAGALALAGVIAAPALSVSYRVLPQGFLFVPVAALGLMAL